MLSAAECSKPVWIGPSGCLDSVRLRAILTGFSGSAGLQACTTASGPASLVASDKAGVDAGLQAWKPTLRRGRTPGSRYSRRWLARLVRRGPVRASAERPSLAPWYPFRASRRWFEDPRPAHRRAGAAGGG